jgi:proline iminopeptidase
MKHVKTVLASGAMSFAFCVTCFGIAGCGPRQKAKTAVYDFRDVTLGGVKQKILITGTDTTLPVLLLLHGGPGFDEMVMFQAYNKKLDDSYVVVNWDQRGAGLSYDSTISPSSMTIDQFVSDAHELIGYLKKRFKKDKIVLLGHSWGSVLGVELVSRYPDDFYAYVGVGQVANMWENEKISLQYVLDSATRSNNQEALKELQSIGNSYPDSSLNGLQKLYLQRTWLSNFGGAVWGRDFGAMFSKAIAANPSLYDSTKTNAGQMFSMNNLWTKVLNIDFFKTTPELKVPVYFFIGLHDYNVSFELTTKYYNQLKAPFKKLVTFENSAHMPPFEEPEKFNAAMSEVAASIK